MQPQFDKSKVFHKPAKIYVTASLVEVRTNPRKIMHVHEKCGKQMRHSYTNYKGPEIWYELVCDNCLSSDWI